MVLNMNTIIPGFHSIDPKAVQDRFNHHLAKNGDSLNALLWQVRGRPDVGEWLMLSDLSFHSSRFWWPCGFPNRKASPQGECPKADQEECADHSDSGSAAPTFRAVAKEWCEMGCRDRRTSRCRHKERLGNHPGDRRDAGGHASHIATHGDYVGHAGRRECLTRIRVLRRNDGHAREVLRAPPSRLRENGGQRGQQNGQVLRTQRAHHAQRHARLPPM